MNVEDERDRGKKNKNNAMFAQTYILSDKKIEKLIILFSKFCSESK